VLQRCPIRLYTDRLRGEDLLGDDDLARLEREVEAAVAEALAFADASPYPDAAEALSDVV
jgi:TPP-dependent pyruvate/acetoin dehydrogenase alpha subunit